MDTDVEQKLRALLRADAPSERDPHFRIALLERRTRQRYQRRQRIVVIASLMLAVLGIVILKLVSGRDALEPAALLRGTFLVLLGVAVLAAALNSARAVQRVLRHVRGP